MKQSAIIHGGGWAAAACSALLSGAGWQVRANRREEVGIPYLTLNRSTLELVQNIFQTQIHGWEIRRRLVFRGSSVFSEVQEPALVIDAVRELRNAWPATSPCKSVANDSWEIFTHGTRDKTIDSGSRTAWIFQGKIHSSQAAEASVFEFVPEGWIFWAPISRREGILQFVLPGRCADGDFCADLFRRSVLQRAVKMGAILSNATRCSASLTRTLIGERWISCGSAAMRFDPVSGDGTGASLRSAILACAVMNAIAAGQDPKPYRDHYTARLANAFRSHLALCEQLYRDGGLSQTWKSELKAMRRAGQRCAARFPPLESIQFQLRGYALVRA